MKRLFVLFACLLAVPAQGQILSIIMGGTNQPAATPTFSPAAGAVANPTTVTASTSTSDGCTIYFDTSNPPVTAQTTYSVTTGVTLYAQARGCAHHSDSLVGSAAYTISGPNTWTLVRHTMVLLPCNDTTSCSATVPAIGSGNVLVLIESGQSGSAHLTSTFGAIGGSWVHPGGNSAGACNSGNPSIISDCAYVLHTTACSSSCNITYTTTPYYANDSADIFEYTPSTGSAAYDTAGVSSGSFSTAPPVVALTISGTSDLVIQNVTAQDHYCTAVGSPYTSATDFTVSPAGSQAGYAAAVNLSSVTASPTWTCGTTRYTTMAVAFK
jgi:hypothetical protein